jgi:hypothetical protein
LTPRRVRQRAGCGRMKGPSRNWMVEKRRKKVREA